MFGLLSLILGGVFFACLFVSFFFSFFLFLFFVLFLGGVGVGRRVGSENKRREREGK